MGEFSGSYRRIIRRDRNAWCIFRGKSLEEYAGALYQYQCYQCSIDRWVSADSGNEGGHAADQDRTGGCREGWYADRMHHAGGNGAHQSDFPENLPDRGISEKRVDL